jgi:O-antigen/teichoic acid export membrane protein
LVRQVAGTVANRIVRLVLGLATSVVIARALNPDGRGSYYVIITVATTTLAMGHLSVEQSQVWLWTRPENRRSVAVNSVLLGLSVGAVAALAAVLVLVVLNPHRLPDLRDHVIALAAVPFAMIVLYANNVLVLQSRIDIVNRAALLGTAAQCGLLLLLGLAGRLSVTWVVVSWAASMVLPAASLVAGIRPRPAERDLALAWRALGRGLRYHLGSASLYLLFRVDILLLAAFSSDAAVGIYSLAVTVAELARIVTDSISQVVLPQQAGSDDGRAVAFTVKTTRVMVFAGLVSIGLGCAAVPLGIPLLYGHAFAGSVEPFFALAPGVFALSGSRAIGACLLRLDRPMLSSAASVIALVLNVGLNLVLIPSYGVVGCAAASSIAYCVLAAIQVVWFVSATRTPLRRLVLAGAA